jgi:hypothetical protein
MRSHGYLFGSPLGYDNLQPGGDWEETGERRTTHNEQLHGLYTPDQI